MGAMNVLIGCECSSLMRDAFLAKGHDAWSCDLKPSEGRQANHLQGDVRWAIEGALHKFPNAIDRRTGRTPIFRKWDLAIFHPECTYLCNSGVKWLYKGGQKKNGRDDERWHAMYDAASFFIQCHDAPIPRIVVENPIMHKYGLAAVGRGRPTQIVQPWMFGHREIKATCFWLKGLRPLYPTDVVGPPDSPEDRKAYARVHRMPSGENRSADRARSYPGICTAAAEQWGQQW